MMQLPDFTQLTLAHGSLTLRPLQRQYLEQLRQWRNQPETNRYLVTRLYITPEQQLHWFEELDWHRNAYFVIIHKDTAVGLVYAHRINIAEKSFEGSILIGNSEYLNTYVPVKAILMLMIYFTSTLGFELIYSTVHPDNRNALELDHALGFKPVHMDNGYQVSRCTASNFFVHSKPYIKALFGSKDVIFDSKRSE